MLSLLGPNAQELFDFCEQRFSLKTVLHFWTQMVSRLQVLHDNGYLHRDLRPECIHIGQGKKTSIVFLTDFTSAKRFICPNSGLHLKHVPNCGVFGTKRFLSLNANVGNQLSRADDLIALGHLMICLLKRGKLPWDMEPLPEFTADLKDPMIF